MLRTSILLALLGALLPAEATLTHYTVTDLQATYGSNLEFLGMSKNGILTARPNDASPIVVRAQNGVREDIIINDYHSNFLNEGFAYSTRDGVLYKVDSGGRTSTGFTTPGEFTLEGQGRNGTIVGQIDSSNPDSYLGVGGFIYDPVNGGRTVELMGGIYVFYFAHINDAGHLVGPGINRDTGQGGLFLWRDGEPAIAISLRFDEQSFAINNADQVVGLLGGDAFYWDAGNLYRPVRYYVPDPAHPGVTNQAVTGASFSDISESGLAVGGAALKAVPGYTPPDSGLKGLVWSPTDGLVWLDDLLVNAPGVQIRGGIAIADDGSIFANGLTNGVYHEYLLTPIIPEPSTPIFLLTSLGYACLLRRRSRAR